MEVSLRFLGVLVGVPHCINCYVVMSAPAMEYKGEEVEPEAVIEAVAAIIGSGMLYLIFISPLLVRAFPVLGAELTDVEGYSGTLNVGSSQSS